MAPGHQNPSCETRYPVKAWLQKQGEERSYLQEKSCDKGGMSTQGVVGQWSCVVLTKC